MYVPSGPFGGDPIVAHMPEGISAASGFDPGREVYVGITGFKILPM